MSASARTSSARTRPVARVRSTSSAASRGVWARTMASASSTGSMIFPDCTPWHRRPPVGRRPATVYHSKRMRRHWLTAALSVSFACGDPGATGPTDTGSGTGTFAPSSSFANQCATPRVGTDPATGRPYPDRPGSTLAENNFLRSWTNELYLWYREVPDLNPASYATAAYFEALKTPATTPSGNPRDRF